MGFKLFPDHWTGGNEETLKRVLADRRIKKIILRREDYLAVYASKLRADKTGAYIRKSLDGSPCISTFLRSINLYDTMTPATPFMMSIFRYVATSGCTLSHQFLMLFHCSCCIT